MPLGGSTISWDGQPLGGESVGLGDDRIRSMKTSVQQALANEHNFPSTGGANTGYHLPGSARAHFGMQSAVSSGDTDGRLMIASDTSRLFGVGSTGTVMLGAGPLALSIGSFVPVTFPQRAYVAIEVGRVKGDASGEFSVTFPNSGFSGIPFIFALPSSLGTNGTSQIRVVTATSSLFTGTIADTSTGNARSNTSLDWVAIGHRTL